MTSELAPVYGGVLIGGRSSRMGRTKHLMMVGGVTLLERSAAALRPHVAQIVIIGEGDIPPACAAWPRVADAAGERGPIAGMLGAMSAHPDAAWVFVACDLARIEAEAVAWVIGQRRPDTIAVLPRSLDGRVEPLLALYEPAARGPLEAISRDRAAAPRKPADGEKGIGPRLLAERDDVATPRVPAELAPCWTNVNTPEEWAALD